MIFKFNPQDIKVLPRINLLSITPTVILEDVEYLSISGEKEIFTPMMVVYYCEHVYLTEQGNYEPLKSVTRMPFLITEDDLKFMKNLGDNIYYYEPGDKDKVLYLSNQEIVRELQHLNSDAQVGDYLVISDDFKIMHLKSSLIKSTYLVDLPTRN